MKLHSFLVIFGLIALSTLPAQAHAHAHAKKKPHALTFDQKIAGLQHHFDLDVRRDNSPVSTERLAEAHHVPLSVVDELRARMTWGQVAVYLSFADQIASKNPQMSTADAVEPLRASRKSGLAWHDIANKNQLSRDNVLMSLAGTKLVRVRTETQLARR